LTGVQKAAILFLTIGPDASSNILKKLPDAEIQKITFEIANTVKVKTNIKETVLDEFVNLHKAKEYILEGGAEYAKNLLSKAVGVQKALEIMEKVGEATLQYRPFGVARKADSQQLLSLIMNEHPQTIALILAYLRPSQASAVISSLPADKQADVARRIAIMDRTSPEVIKEVERLLEKRLSSFMTDTWTPIQLRAGLNRSLFAYIVSIHSTFGRLKGRAEARLTTRNRGVPNGKSIDKLQS
jgi:flagellar motor switch protein FliG